VGVPGNLRKLMTSREPRMLRRRRMRHLWFLVVASVLIVGVVVGVLYLLYQQGRM